MPRCERVRSPGSTGLRFPCTLQQHRRLIHLHLYCRLFRRGQRLVTLQTLPSWHNMPRRARVRGMSCRVVFLKLVHRLFGVRRWVFLPRWQRPGAVFAWLLCFDGQRKCVHCVCSGKLSRQKWKLRLQGVSVRLLLSRVRIGHPLSDGLLQYRTWLDISIRLHPMPCRQLLPRWIRDFRLSSRNMGKSHRGYWTFQPFFLPALPSGYVVVEW